MAVLSRSTKTKLGLKGAKVLARNPAILRTGTRAAAPAGRLGFRLAKPVAKRRARQRGADLSQAAQTAAAYLITYAPQVAQQLGLVEPPRRRRTGPLLVAGVVVGASAVYFLEPANGKAHREQVLKLVK